jgi:hypothetical protein
MPAHMLTVWAMKGDADDGNDIEFRHSLSKATYPARCSSPAHPRSGVRPTGLRLAQAFPTIAA